MSDEIDDSESISFIGYRDSPPKAVEIDFEKPIWQVEFYTNKDAYFRVVNAESEEVAITIAVNQFLEEGVNVYAVDHVAVNKLEVISDGDSVVEASSGASD